MRNPLAFLRLSDVRGLAGLATQAAAGATRIAEGVHQSVWSTLGFPGGEAPGRARGLTGLVYGSIHAAVLATGRGVDTALARLHPAAPADAPVPETPRREALLAVLNGVLGDRLAAEGNPLAVPMTLRYRGAALDEAVPPTAEVTGKVAVLVHGLCLSDRHWQAERDGEAVDHGAALASALGYTPVYLRYNSGLHTSQNGRALAAHLERLVAGWPVPVADLTVVAHSMGGLVARSACHYAGQEALRWPGLLKHLVFLGTPHHGAPLERAGNWVDALLGSTPYTAPLAALGQLRSAGITDLRYGYVLDEDWQDHDRFHRRPDTRQRVPLPEGVACYAVAATRAARRSALANRLTGDDWVPLHSALSDADPRRSVRFEAAAQRIVYRTSHLGLLSHPDVSRQIVQWLTPAAGRARADGGARRLS